MTGVTVKFATGIHCIGSVPSTRTPGRSASRPTSSARLAQGGRDEVGVRRLGPAARERDLARVVAAAVGALGEDDARLAVLVRVEQDQHRGRPRRRSRRRPTAAAGAARRSRRTTGISAAGPSGRTLGQRLEAPQDVLEAHRRPAERG